MDFLSSQSICHGDLACRNILLTEELVAKISDFGLSKRLYTKVSTEAKGMNQPIKWLALEALQFGEVSSKSDVWSFGVLLWELFELGNEPYSTG